MGKYGVFIDNSGTSAMYGLVLPGPAVCVDCPSRDRYDALLEKDLGSAELNVGVHHHSRDSAIDTDLHDIETETLELCLVTVIVHFAAHLSSVMLFNRKYPVTRGWARFFWCGH